MVEKFRFRAFISYSHRDERWAKWLHRALESYRLPPRLVGTPGASGPVPAYFAPVFRDRDELSTSPDLSEQVRRALRDSAALIVVCSPAAAASKWVNEEIRRFRELGRADRIFCLIVDGDPEARNAGERCFPPALFEADEGERHEPLAADARKFADGKALAKLKLISGILGVRLDALRQREQQRRRVRVFAGVAAGVAALALVSVAVLSTFEERRSREALDRFVESSVSLSNELQSVANLETLRRLGDMIYDNLSAVNPEQGTREQRLQIAQVLRNLGQVYFQSNEFDEAERAFGDSLKTLDTLQRENPDDLDILLEKGIGEYWVGAVNKSQGELDAFARHMRAYLQAAETAANAEPQNTAYLLEKASALVNLGIDEFLRAGGDLALATERLQNGVATLEALRDLAPDDADARQAYAAAIVWLADVQYATCDIGEAVKTRLKAVDLNRSDLLAQPNAPAPRARLAYSLAGVGGFKEKLGADQQALTTYREVAEIFSDLSRFDPGNPEYRWLTLVWQFAVERLDAPEDPAAAADRLAAVVDSMAAMLADQQQVSPEMQSDYVHVLLHLADAADRAGQAARAREAVADALTRVVEAVRDHPGDQAFRQQLSRATFLAWEQEMDHAEAMAILDPAEDSPGDERQVNCRYAPHQARMAILRGDRQRAERLTAALLKTGFWEQDFVRFCRRYDLCPEQ